MIINNQVTTNKTSLHKKGVVPMKSLMERTWISPFVAVSFFILSITGILMLLHVKSSGIATLHEWIVPRDDLDSK